MLKRKLFIISFTIIFIGIILVSIIPISSVYNKDLISNEDDYPKASGTLEGAEDILITKIKREAELNGYGLVNYEDEIDVLNSYENPIVSFFIGIPLTQSDDLVFFEAVGEDEDSLSVERNELVVKDFEMIEIYFDTPLKPFETETITFIHSYKNQIDYYINEEDNDQYLNFAGYVYPLTPYEAIGSISAVFEYPETSIVRNFTTGGTEDRGENTITFTLGEYEPTEDYLDPFLENLNDNGQIQVNLEDDEISKIEIDEVIREIYISSWGVIKVTEEYEFKNKGEASIDELFFQIPGASKEVKVYDDLGEILGVTLDPEETYYNKSERDLNLDLSENRVDLRPGSKLRFNVEYFLPFEKYVTWNWFELLIKIDILTSTYEYLGRDQTIKIIIEGCFILEEVSTTPDALENSVNSLILVFKSDYITSQDENELEIKYILNIFDMLLRPIVFFLIIALISSGFVVFLKSKKETETYMMFRKEILPITEIRELCSLYEERNALLIEIRMAEEDLKRKKIIKKKYKNIMDKNNKKIQEIDKEIIPFKKTVREADPTLEANINKLDILEAERQSINDSLNLLEARYKRGKLPSKAAYQKLSENFIRRRRKIDKSIDKNIQSLRSYLL
ncbi:MAG: hypothetical protein ACFFAO_17720 [Candidatus Hermodarchaeota archaeon]